jgi:hypothetical protein
MGIDSPDDGGLANDPERQRAENPNDDPLGGGAGKERELESATDPDTLDHDDLAQKLDVDPERGDTKG